MTETTETTEMTATAATAAYEKSLADCRARIAAAEVDRAAAIKPDADAKLVRRLGEILTALNVEQQLAAGIEMAIEHLAPAVARERQAERDAENEAERHAIAGAKHAVIKTAATIDAIADKLVRAVAAQFAHGAPLHPRCYDLNGRLCESELGRRAANARILPAVAGRSKVQTLALRALVARLLDAAGHTEGVDDFIVVNRTHSGSGITTFEAAARAEAEAVAQCLRVA